MSAPAGAQRSEDGHYYWDGSQWQLIDQSAAPAQSVDPGSGGQSQTGQLSEDGQHQWDGTQWQPTQNQSAAAADDPSGVDAGSDGSAEVAVEGACISEDLSDSDIESVLAAAGVSLDPS